MQNKRLIISGTYSTGKTTTTTALSLATGIPMINALSAREILTDLYPGRRFQDMDSVELMALGLKRLEERIRAEIILYKDTGCFISDGSVLNEWIYGTVRMKVGINPGSPIYHQIAKAILSIPGRSFFKKYLAAYGQVANQHAKKWYTDVVHLPVEFEMKKDGHRPVSEKYRKLSDIELKKAYEELGFHPVEISGSQSERLNAIIRHYQLPQILSTKEAILQAEEIIKRNRESVSKKIIEQYKEPSMKEKISFITKF
jgi:hypothetical protein